MPRDCFPRQPWMLRSFSCSQSRPLIALLVLAPTLIYLFYLFALPQLLRFRFRSDLGWYDLGLYGFGPSKSYISFPYQSPRVELVQWDSSRCDPSFVFLAPRGDSIAYPGPMILDAQGELVWMKHNWGITQDFKVQRYRDQDYLIYWEGDVVEGRGQGSWHMLDDSYIRRFEITPVGNHDGDLHDFQVTEDDTALVTVYDILPADLTPVGGPAFGWIYDGLFQEIDIATGELMFEWRASEHFPINSTFKTFVGSGTNRDEAFDYYHINSVDKDDQGNYIVSARHTHTVSCIDRNTGEVLWTLGGKLNEFEDISVSEGSATSFSWQHDARWHGDNTLTLFDNAASSNIDPSAVSRGMTIDLNIHARTASLRAEYYHPQDMEAVSQGNLQLLPNGNVFIGWGHSAAFTEFDPDGTPLCNVHFGASAYFTFGRVVSYRALKGSWVGRPRTVPDVVVNGNLYVSWNGATEVVAWQLEVWDGTGDLRRMVYEPRGKFHKTGFETEIPFPEDIGDKYFRVVALDSNGNEIGTTEALQRDSPSSGFAGHQVLVAIGLLLCGCVLAGLYCTLRPRFSRWGLPRWGLPRWRLPRWKSRFAGYRPLKEDEEDPLPDTNGRCEHHRLLPQSPRHGTGQTSHPTVNH